MSVYFCHDRVYLRYYYTYITHIYILFEVIIISDRTNHTEVIEVNVCLSVGPGGL